MPDLVLKKSSPDLPETARLCYEFVLLHLKNKIPIDSKILATYYLDKVNPRYKAVCVFKDGRFNGYKRVSTSEVFKQYGDGYCQGEARMWLKYHIGNLVLRGYFQVLPVIKLEDKKVIKNG